MTCSSAARYERRIYAANLTMAGVAASNVYPVRARSPVPPVGRPRLRSLPGAPSSILEILAGAVVAVGLDRLFQLVMTQDVMAALQLAPVAVQVHRTPPHNPPAELAVRIKLPLGLNSGG